MSEIILQGTEIDGRKIISRVKPPRNLKKYFKTLTFFAYYDHDITAEKSILNIPFLAAVLPLAWLSGSDIVVDELDRTFKLSMDRLRREFINLSPRANYTTKIKVNKTVDNLIGCLDPLTCTALLFSGGVDSTYSLLSNMELRPRLYMIWGVDYYPYPKHSKHWDKAITVYSDFAKKQGLELHLIKTNVGDIFDVVRIEHDFHELLYDGGFRYRLQHSLVLIPILAPVSIGRFDRIIIASSLDSSKYRNYAQYAMATEPRTDEKIIWADLQVKNDGYASRKEKVIGHIKEYLKKGKLLLRVCYRKKPLPNKLNCSICEKCLRTIITLVLSGIDPNVCGFEVDSSTFQLVKGMLLNRKLTGDNLYEWGLIQNFLPNNIEHVQFDSENFFQWFKNLDLKSIEKDVWIYRDIYNKLPYPLSRLLDKFYRKIGIDLHYPSPYIVPKLDKIYPKDLIKFEH
jgi:hypothetical protein